VCLGKVLFLAKGKKVEVPLARLGDASGKGPLTALIPLSLLVNGMHPRPVLPSKPLIPPTPLLVLQTSWLPSQRPSSYTVLLLQKSIRHLNSRPSEPSTYIPESGLTITIHCGRNGMPKKTLKGVVPG
jgi:hypothetical protein